MDQTILIMALTQLPIMVAIPTYPLDWRQEKKNLT